MFRSRDPFPISAASSRPTPQFHGHGAARHLYRPRHGQTDPERQIRRGDLKTIEAVIWFSDLRRSTELASTLEPKDYIAVLNDFFEATASAVAGEGGEVHGNIGIPRRLDFTVTGEAVNICSRIQDLCKELGQKVLASSEIAMHFPAEYLSSGHVTLRGSPNPREIRHLESRGA